MFLLLIALLDTFVWGSIFDGAPETQADEDNIVWSV